MRQLIGNYTFSTSAKTITLTDFTTIRLDRLRLITDVTTNKILYNFADSTVATATVATNVITLSALQGGESNSDKLEIDYDTITGDPTYDTPPLASNAAKETGGNLASIKSDLDTVVTNTTGSATAANQSTANTSLSSIATNTSNEATNTSNINTATGAKADSAATDSTSSWSVIAILKGLYAKLAGTLTVSGTVTSNAGTNLNTSALALESGGNLATIVTNTGNGATSANQTNGNQQTKLTNGTNVADVAAGDSGYNAQAVGNSTKTYSFTTSSSGAQTLLANTDCRGYAWITVVTTGVGSGLAWNGQFAPNSGGTYISSSKWLSATSATATMASLGTVVNPIYSSPVISNYFQLSISALTSGTVSGYVILSTMPLTPQTIMMGIISSASTMVPLRSAGSAGTNNGGDNELAAVSYGQYNSSAPTVTTGNYNPLQTDINGRLYVQAPSATGSGVPANAFYIAAKSSGSNLIGLLDVAGNGVNSGGSAGLLAVGDYQYNGSNYDVRRGNIDSGALITASGATTTQTGSDQTNYNGKGVKVILDMTTVGTGSVTLEIDGKDTASGKYYAILTGAAVVTNSTNVYTIYPGMTTAANAAVSDILPRTWRVKVTANNANATTYTVGASVIL